MVSKTSLFFNFLIVFKGRGLMDLSPHYLLPAHIRHRSTATSSHWEHRGSSIFLWTLSMKPGQIHAVGRPIDCQGRKISPAWRKPEEVKNGPPSWACVLVVVFSIHRESEQTAYFSSFVPFQKLQTLMDVNFKGHTLSRVRINRWPS